MTPPPMHEVIRVFARIGILSFGGPGAQIALMHREPCFLSIFAGAPWMGGSRAVPDCPRRRPE